LSAWPIVHAHRAKDQDYGSLRQISAIAMMTIGGMSFRYILLCLLILALAALVATLFLHLLPMPSLAALHNREHDLEMYGEAHPFRLAAVFVIAYLAFAALPLPGAELLTIAAGSLFGLVEGTLLVSFAAMIGSCSAFLLGRFLLGDAARRHLASRLAIVAREIENEGPFYLFALRMIPAIPFFVLNVAMGATSLKLTTFYWVSQLGMLPATIAYVNAGREIGQLDSLSGILSPGTLAAFAVLGLLPLAARRLVPILRRRLQGRSA
jgi:uncharacterized membrane protein YdjX (TVP38/TMEM64 family)